MGEITFSDRECRGILTTSLILSVLLHQSEWAYALNSYSLFQAYLFEVLIWTGIYSFLLGLNWAMIKILRDM